MNVREEFKEPRDIEHWVERGNIITVGIVRRYSELTNLSVCDSLRSLKFIGLRTQVQNAKTIEDLKLVISEMLR